MRFPCALDPLRYSQYLGQSPGQEPWEHISSKALPTTGFGASPWPSGLSFPIIKHDHFLVLRHLMVLDSLWVFFPQLRYLAPRNQGCLLPCRPFPGGHQPTTNQSPWPWQLDCDSLEAGGKRGSMQRVREADTFSFIHSFIHSFTHLQTFTVLSCASPYTGNTIVKKSQCLPLGKMSELEAGWYKS